MQRVERDACVSVWSTRAYVWSNSLYVERTRSRGGMYILHGKEPPYLTGQSHLIDTRRVPNTLRPPIWYPSFPLSLPILLSFSLSLSLFRPIYPFRAFSQSLSLSLPSSLPPLTPPSASPRTRNHESASVARAALVTPVAATDFTSNHGNGNTSYVFCADASL